MESHVKILGTLYIILGVLGLLAAGLTFFILIGAGLISGEREALAATSIVGTILAILITMISVPGVICGWGLLQRKPWARVLVLILGCLNLFNVPLGTVLGIYTLWVLINPEVEPVFSRN